MKLRDLHLVKLTGKTGAWWVDFIQRRIPTYCTPTDNPAHPTCDAGAWLRDLSDEIWNRVRTWNDLTKSDENILCAAAMSLITTLWNVRLRRVKAYDARRPVEARRVATEKLLGYELALAACLLDESEDHALFPLPKWDVPFQPDAIDGDFF